MDKIIKVNGDKGLIYSPYEANMIPIYRSGGKWNIDKKCWVSGDISFLEKLEREYGFQFLGKQELLEFIKAKQESETKNLLASEKIETETDITTDIPLFNYQKLGVAYALKNKKVIIGSEMGTGKSIQAITTVEIAQSYPVLIICPAVTKYNWQNEILKWTGKESYIISNDNGDYKNEKYVISTYGMTHKVIDQQYKTVICDEFHKIKENKTLQARNVKDIIKNSNPEYRLFLSGTPILNKPKELINPLTTLGVFKSIFGNWKEFTERYCDTKNKEITIWDNKKEKYVTRIIRDINGANNLTELEIKLKSNCMIRHLKKDVSKDLPDKIVSIVDMDINRYKYDLAVKSLKSYILDKVKNDKAFYASIAHLDAEQKAAKIAEKQKSSIEKAYRAETLVRINALKDIVMKEKIEYTKEYINEMLDEEVGKILIFCQSVDVIDKMQDWYKDKAVKITGNSNDTQRQEAVKGFQENDKIKLFFMTTAGGIGINLTAGSHVIMMNQNWNHGTDDQIIDRLHRIGQKKAVNVYFIHARNTIDKAIYQLIESKRKVISEALGDDSEEGIIDSIVNSL